MLPRNRRNARNHIRKESKRWAKVCSKPPLLWIQHGESGNLYDADCMGDEAGQRKYHNRSQRTGCRGGHFAGGYLVTRNGSSNLIVVYQPCLCDKAAGPCRHGSAVEVDQLACSRRYRHPPEGGYFFLPRLHLLAVPRACYDGSAARSQERGEGEDKDKGGCHSYRYDVAVLGASATMLQTVPANAAPWYYSERAFYVFVAGFEVAVL
ncbi:hypothetical protein V494_02490, partial [Pseudogymnoascus sp. VKM F-4513 (FW-928)]